MGREAVRGDHLPFPGVGEVVEGLGVERQGGEDQQQGKKDRAHRQASVQGRPSVAALVRAATEGRPYTGRPTSATRPGTGCPALATLRRLYRDLHSLRLPISTPST